jgi:predicted ArsR family transcriptional regulator
VGRSIAGPQDARQKNGSIKSRLGKALTTLEAIGGAARIEKEQSRVLICSESCPLAAAVAEHPEVCRLAETLLSEIIGMEVREQCDREGAPRCRFEVIGTENRKGQPKKNQSF